MTALLMNKDSLGDTARLSRSQLECWESRGTVLRCKDGFIGSLLEIFMPLYKSLPSVSGICDLRLATREHSQSDRMLNDTRPCVVTRLALETPCWIDEVRCYAEEASMAESSVALGAEGSFQLTASKKPRLSVLQP